MGAGRPGLVDIPFPVNATAEAPDVPSTFGHICGPDPELIEAFGRAVRRISPRKWPAKRQKQRAAAAQPSRS